MSELRQEWATPPDFFAAIKDEFDPNIDVCATRENHKCPTFITPEQDALAEDNDWLNPDLRRVAWCNPGFNNMMPWLSKARIQADKYRGIVLVLGLCAPSTEWWRAYALLADEIRLIGGKRIQFEPAPGVPRSSNARENALFIFDGVPKRRPFAGPWIWTWYWNATEDGKLGASR